MLDVVHYIDSSEQEGLIRRAMRGLNPGGVLILRDGDASMEGKHSRTRLTEFFSTTVFGFNKRDADTLHYIDRATVERLMTEEGLQMREVLTSQVTSNTIFIIQKIARDGNPS
jgi:predicted methyltransferase